MEIADIICINKYDEFQKACERMKRQIESAISLTMSKHMFSDIYAKNSKIEWFTPVELISAKNNLNIDLIWKHALSLREMLGEENVKLQR